MSIFSRKIFESGRTLLEMIGVFCIISLLSVAGIQYYRLVHIKLHTNDIMENIYKRTATRDGSKHSKDLLEKYHQTAYKYGIDVPKPHPHCKNRMMIPIGQIDPADTPLTPGICMTIANRIISETNAFKGVYNANCEEITSQNIEMFCANANAFYVWVGGTRPQPQPRVQPVHQEPAEEPHCHQLDAGESCPSDQYKGEDLCCHDCPIGQKQSKAGTSCVNFCDELEADDCCNPEKQTSRKYGNCQICVNGEVQADPACAQPQACPNGGTQVTAPDANSMDFVDSNGNQCPQNSYIDLDSVDPQKGCCLPCPEATPLTNGVNAIGSDQCRSAEITCADIRELEDKDGNCYPCEWVRHLDLGDNADEQNGWCIDWGKRIRIQEHVGDVDLSVLTCNPEKPLRDKDGACHSCDTHEQVNVEGVEAYCNICDGSSDEKHLRKLSEFFQYSDYPRNPQSATGSGNYCNFTCPDDNPLLYSKDNVNWLCGSCGSDDQLIENSRTLTVRDCERICDGRDNGPHLKRIFIQPLSRSCAKSCPDNKPLIDAYGVCHSCDEKLEITTSMLDDCEKVCNGSNTTSHAKRTQRAYCSLATCPPETPLQTYWNKCHSCDDFKASIADTWYMYHPSAVADCGVCDGSDDTIHKRRRLLFQRYCMQECPEGQLLATPTSEANTPITFCHNCDEKEPIYLGNQRADECNSICPNRHMNEKGYCNFACPNDRPILGADGECYACKSEIKGIYLGNKSDSHHTTMYEENCARCPEDRSLLRVLGNKYYCILPCPAERPLLHDNGNFTEGNIDYTMYCSPCDNPQVVLRTPNKADCATYCNGSDNHIHKLRRKVGDDYYCMACPEEKPIIAGSFGDECHSCDETNEIHCVHSWGTCSDLKKCDGSNDTTQAKRIFGKDTYDATGIKWYESVSYSCLGRPLTDEQGYCQKCDYTGPIPDENYETLALCPKQRYVNGNFSYPCNNADTGIGGLGNNSSQCAHCGGTIDEETETCIF